METQSIKPIIIYNQSCPRIKSENKQIINELYFDLIEFGKTSYFEPQITDNKLYAIEQASNNAQKLFNDIRRLEIGTQLNYLVEVPEIPLGENILLAHHHSIIIKNFRNGFLAIRTVDPDPCRYSDGTVESHLKKRFYIVDPSDIILRTTCEILRGQLSELIRTLRLK